MSDENDSRQWSWWAAPCEDPEIFEINESTREEVILAASNQWPGETFTIIEATQDGPFDCDVFDEDGTATMAVIEKFMDLNSHRFGDYGGDGLYQDSLIEHMNAAFADYMREHGDDIIVWGFTGTRNKQVFVVEQEP